LFFIISSAYHSMRGACAFVLRTVRCPVNFFLFLVCGQLRRAARRGRLTSIQTRDGRAASASFSLFRPPDVAVYVCRPADARWACGQERRVQRCRASGGGFGDSSKKKPLSLLRAPVYCTAGSACHSSLTMSLSFVQAWPSCVLVPERHYSFFQR